MYGIPNMKLDKTEVVSNAGSTAAPRGWNSSPAPTSATARWHARRPDTAQRTTRVLLATGATVPRDLPIPGRELQRRALRHGLSHRQHEKPARQQHCKTATIISAKDKARDRDWRRRHRHRLHRYVTAPRLQEPGELRAVSRNPGRPRTDNPWPTWPRIFEPTTATRKRQTIRRRSARLLHLFHRIRRRRRRQSEGGRTVDVRTERTANSKTCQAPNANGQWTWCFWPWVSSDRNTSCQTSWESSYDERSNYGGVW